MAPTKCTLKLIDDRIQDLISFYSHRASTCAFKRGRFINNGIINESVIRHIGNAIRESNRFSPLNYRETGTSLFFQNNTALLNAIQDRFYQ